MNQAIRSRVYGKGNRHHVEFMVDLCGMNETEAAVFRLLHDGRPDSYIEDAVGITKPTGNISGSMSGSKRCWASGKKPDLNFITYFITVLIANMRL